MRRLAPAKVNACLYVGKPRADGLHPLVSVVRSIGLYDELTLVTGGGRDEVVCPGVPGENLATRAIQAFREATGWDGAPVQILIEKSIPVAAGLGGGSSDAAATLQLLSKLSGIAIPDDLPFSLGADVPVMVRGGRALMTGAGEHVHPLPKGPEDHLVILPSPHGGLSTPDVYRRADELGTPRDLDGLEEAVLADPDAHFVNDLEPAAIDLQPEIADRLQALRDEGVPAMVSGSGPTVFGVFDDPRRADAVAERLGGMVAIAL